jgi:hypothetical protein
MTLRKKLMDRYDGTKRGTYRPKNARLIELRGRAFGKLTVIERAHNAKHGQPQWLCLCQCGVLKIIRGDSLRQSRTVSCATCQKGISRTPEHFAYSAAKSRCTKADHPNYQNYGGRGIEFRFVSFQAFLAELGKKPMPQHTLDRINNDGHYEPGNVRWATRQEQQLNRRPRRRREEKTEQVNLPSEERAA